MSKFNSTIKSKPDTTNFAGGKAYKQSPKLAIASLLLTSFASGLHYETESDAVERLKSLYGESYPKRRDAHGATPAHRRFHPHHCQPYKTITACWKFKISRHGT